MIKNSGSIKTFVALDTGMSKEALELSLPRGEDVDIVGIVDGLDESWATLQQTPNDLLLIACAGHSERTLTLINDAVKERPSRPIVVLSLGSTNGFTKKVFAAGADDVAVLPLDQDDVRFLLQKAMARKAGANGGVVANKAPIICVLGPKGGTGKTLTSTSLAVAMAEMGHKVALVDLDLQFGDVGLCLGLSPDATIYDLVRAGGALDEDKLDVFMMEHSSGVKVLLAPSRPDHAAVVTVDFLRELYALLRQSFDYVIVDTPPGFTPEVITTIDNASAVCMVGMLDALSLKNTKLGLETLDLMGFPSDRVKLVLNRAKSRVGISEDDVFAIVGRNPDVFIPSDRDIPRAVNEGKPIVTAKPQSEAAAGFRQLATSFIKTAATPRVGGLRRLLAKRA